MGCNDWWKEDRAPMAPQITVGTIRASLRLLGSRGFRLRLEFGAHGGAVAKAMRGRSVAYDVASDDPVSAIVELVEKIARMEAANV